MTIRHVVSLAALGPESVAGLVERSIDISNGKADGQTPLAGKVVGIYFRGSSTRTRTSFSVGALKLGAHIITYGPQDLQMATGETVEDTGRVLSGYLDALVVRTNAAEAEMQALACQDSMAVINAMSSEEHPTQALADLATIREAFGRLDGVHVLYLGEGNNSASALAYALGQTPGTRLTLATPAGFGLPPAQLERAQALARDHGSEISEQHHVDTVPAGVDVVYTTRWNTMGVTKADPEWRSKFRPFSVSPELMARVSNSSKTIFMHDLPAVRGDDVHDEVLDGPQSWAWRQARYKMWSAMAVLEWSLAAA